MRRYSKLVTTICWFVAFLSVGLMGMATGTYKPPLHKTLLIGDSIAAMAPYPFPRAASCGANLPVIKFMLSCLPTDKYNSVVLIWGVADINRGVDPSEIERDTHIIEQLIKKKFPKADCVIIPPHVIGKIGEKHSVEIVDVTTHSLLGKIAS